MGTFTSTITLSEHLYPADSPGFAFGTYAANSDWTSLYATTNGGLYYTQSMQWFVGLQHDSASGDTMGYLYRSHMVFDTNAISLPTDAYITDASLVLGVDSGAVQYTSLTSNDLALCAVRFAPTSLLTAQAADFNKSLNSTEISRVSLSAIRYDLGFPSYVTLSLNATGLDWLRTYAPNRRLPIGLRLNLDLENTGVNSAESQFITAIGGVYIGSKSPAALVLTYETPRTPDDITRRRFELPVEPQRFAPTRTSTRWGQPLTLQQVIAQKSTTLGTQVQDYLNEQPPLILRNVAITPNSQVTAQAGTILVSPSTESNPVWYKQYGSGNTGWVNFSLNT